MTRFSEETALLEQVEWLTDTIGKMTLKAPRIAGQAQPGQFVQIQTPGKLLRRPISIFDVQAQSGKLVLVVQAVGQGTRNLLALEPGQSVQILGPLGQGFRLQGERACLVGGGVGVAPLHFLARSLWAQGGQVSSFIGFRSKDLVFASEDLSAFGKVTLSTDDGSVGIKGNAVEAFLAQLEKESPDVVYACGPTPMMKALQAALGQTEIPAFVSLEEHMGCGIGACLTCNCAISVGDGKAYKRVCKDGPVFALKEVMFGG